MNAEASLKLRVLLTDIHDLLGDSFDQTRPFRFLDLPRELRDHIYEISFVIDPWETRIDGSCHIGTGLLRVNKQLRKEALPYFLDNDWIVLGLTEEISSRLESAEASTTPLAIQIPENRLELDSGYSPCASIDVKKENDTAITSFFLVSSPDLPFVIRCIASDVTLSGEESRLLVDVVFLESVSEQKRDFTMITLKGLYWSNSKISQRVGDAETIHELQDPEGIEARGIEYIEELNGVIGKVNETDDLARCLAFDGLAYTGNLGKLSKELHRDEPNVAIHAEIMTRTMIGRSAQAVFHACVVTDNIADALYILDLCSSCEDCDSEHPFGWPAIGQPWTGVIQYQVGRMYKELGLHNAALYAFLNSYLVRPDRTKFYAEEIVNEMEELIQQGEIPDPSGMLSYNINWVIRPFAAALAEGQMEDGTRKRLHLNFQSTAEAIGSLPCHHWNTRNLMYFMDFNSGDGCSDIDPLTLGDYAKEQESIVEAAARLTVE